MKIPICCKLWAKSLSKKLHNTKLFIFVQYEVIFQALVTYLCKTFEKLRKYSLKAPEIKKKNMKIQPRNTQELRSKKKGSNAKNLRKLSLSQRKRFL